MISKQNTGFGCVNRTRESCSWQDKPQGLPAGFGSAGFPLHPPN